MNPETITETGTSAGGLERDEPPVGQPCGRRRAWASRPGRHGRTVLPRIRREWTGPNDGAVSVANTHGCAVIVSGMPLLPARLARTSCRASRLYTAEQAGQTASRRFPQATCRTPDRMHDR